MKFQQWPKRDPDKNYFKVPNEVFHIGLSYPEISIYCYLLSIEDRETYQCYPSYKTIGKALGMSENTVSKYVRSLEENGLIRTEPTMVRSKDGRPLNAALHHPSNPGGNRIVLRAAVDGAGVGHRAPACSETPAKAGKPRVTACGPLCGPMPGGAESLPLPAGSGRCGPFVRGVAAQGFRPFLHGTEGRKKEQEKALALLLRRGGHFRPQCGRFRELELALF